MSSFSTASTGCHGKPCVSMASTAATASQRVCYVSIVSIV